MIEDPREILMACEEAGEGKGGGGHWELREMRGKRKKKIKKIDSLSQDRNVYTRAYAAQEALPKDLPSGNDSSSGSSGSRRNNGGPWAQWFN